MRLACLAVAFSACTASSAAPAPELAPAAPQQFSEKRNEPVAESDASALQHATRIVFVEDDFPGALELARRQGKALFVDAWAEWCHTCLSMQSYVFSDRSLAPLAERVVFASLDTDRDESAAFLARYAVDAWPTFFMLDPGTGRVLAQWQGAASTAEMRAFIAESLAALDAIRVQKLPTSSPLSLLMAAHERHAASDFRAAAAAYAQALRAAPDDWPRRSEALYGRLQALGQSGQYDECARFGIEHAERVSGAVTPSDFARTLQRCSDNVASPELRRAARRAALTRLRRIVEAPPPEMSVDDRADALEGYAEALIAEGDRNSARTVEQQRLRLMEEAAESATSPQMAQTYDYGRARAYVALGRAGEAVRLLEGRMRQLPDSYEPPARLASVLAQIGRHKEALTAVERALQLSYGPRKLQYLALKARILEALGDRAAAIAALEQEVQGYEALPPGHANPRRVDDARKRLAAARRAKPR